MIVAILPKCMRSGSVPRRHVRLDRLHQPGELGYAASFLESVADNVDWTVEGTDPLCGRYLSKADFIAATFDRLAGVVVGGAVLEVRLRDRVRFSRQVMVKDELADTGTLGDSTNLADVSVKRGYPFEGGTCEAVPLQIAKVGHLMHQDVRTPGNPNQVVVDGGVAREDDRAIGRVEAEGEGGDRVAVHHRHGGDVNGSVFEDR